MAGTTTWIRPLDEAADALTAHWEVDGSECRTSRGLFTEWAGALRFPEYFGHNWSAFDDSLREAVSRARTTGPEAGPTAVLVREAGDLLADEPERALAVLLDILAEVAGSGEPDLLLLLDDEPDRLADLGRRLAAAGWVTELLGSGT